MTAPQPLLLVGAGGLARETVEAVRAANQVDPRFRLIGYLDDDPDNHGRVIAGLPVLGPPESVRDHLDAAVVICTGRPGDNTSRRRIVDRLGLPPQQYATVLHPAATVPPGSLTGPGTVVLAGVIATTVVSIGSHVAVMPSVVLTHDDQVEDYVTVGAGALFAGGVQVAVGAYIGSGVTVRERLRIGAWSLVGMGSLVLCDVPDGEVWYGSPARRAGCTTTPVEVA